MHISLSKIIELADSGVISKTQSWTLAILNDFNVRPKPKQSQISQHMAKGGVYFLRCGFFIKIGWTKAIGERMRTLQCACPEKLELLHLDEFLERKDEAILHRLFRKNRSYGEWFSDDCREIEAYILSRYEVCRHEYKMIELKKEWAANEQ